MASASQGQFAGRLPARGSIRDVQQTALRERLGRIWRFTTETFFKSTSSAEEFGRISSFEFDLQCGARRKTWRKVQFVSPFSAIYLLRANSYSQCTGILIRGCLCLASSSLNLAHVEGWSITRRRSILFTVCLHTPMNSANSDCDRRAFRRRDLKRSAISGFSHGLVSIFPVPF